MAEATRSCTVCGREIEWRRRWMQQWQAVRYCSAACRRAKLTAMDARLERAIVELLERRARGASICPSEAARSVADGDGWRGLMEQARRAARRLVAQGRIDMLQRGRRVDPSRAKGPIRLRLRCD